MTYREFAEYVQLGKEPSDKKFDPSTPREELQYTSTYTRIQNGMLSSFREDDTLIKYFFNIKGKQATTQNADCYIRILDGINLININQINLIADNLFSIINTPNKYLNFYNDYYITDLNYNILGNTINLNNNEYAYTVIEGKAIPKKLEKNIPVADYKFMLDSIGWEDRGGEPISNFYCYSALDEDEDKKKITATQLIELSEIEKHFKVEICFKVYGAFYFGTGVYEETGNFDNYWGQTITDLNEFPKVNLFPNTYYDVKNEMKHWNYSWELNTNEMEKIGNGKEIDGQVHYKNIKLILTGEVTKPIYINRITPNEEGDLNLEEFDLVDLEEYLAKEKDWNSNYIDKLFGYIEDSDKYTMKIGAKTWSAPNIYGSHYGWKGKIERLTPKYYKTADRIFIPRDYIEGFERQIRKLEVKNGIS